MTREDQRRVWVSAGLRADRGSVPQRPRLLVGILAIMGVLGLIAIGAVLSLTGLLGLGGLAVPAHGADTGFLEQVKKGQGGVADPSDNPLLDCQKFSTCRQDAWLNFSQEISGPVGSGAEADQAYVDQAHEADYPHEIDRPLQLRLTAADAAEAQERHDLDQSLVHDDPKIIFEAVDRRGHLDPDSPVLKLTLMLLITILLWVNLGFGRRQGLIEARRPKKKQTRGRR